MELDAPHVVAEAFRLVSTCRGAPPTTPLKRRRVSIAVTAGSGLTGYARIAGTCRRVQRVILTNGASIEPRATSKPDSYIAGQRMRILAMQQIPITRNGVRFTERTRRMTAEIPIRRRSEEERQAYVQGFEAAISVCRNKGLSIAELSLKMMKATAQINPQQGGSMESEDQVQGDDNDQDDNDNGESTDAEVAGAAAEGAADGATSDDPADE